jgi:hypothetical protein
MRTPLASGHRQRRGIRRPKLGDLVAECHDNLDLRGGALTDNGGDLPQTFEHQVMIAFGTQIFAPGRFPALMCGTKPRLGLAAAQTDAHTPAQAC